MSGAYTALERARAARESTRENQARNAFSFGFNQTAGFGEFQFQQEISFELAYATQPAVLYGFECDDELIETRLPRCSGFVYRWHRDAKNAYVGAWVAVTVDTQSAQITPVGVEPNYTIRHSFMFVGLGYKSLLIRAGQMD
jgi:hypothetical protein